MLTTITLHGRLGKLFGRVWTLDVKTPNEAIRAIATLKPAFKKFLCESEKLGVVYRFCANNRAMDAAELLLKMPGKSYDLFPIPQGSKRAGIFQIIIGVVLIAASWYAGGAAGWAYLGNAGFGLATAAFYLGASMILGGISSLILNPKVGATDLSDDSKRSYIFSGSSQTTRQGGPVPVGYGKLHIGACVISAGLNTDGFGVVAVDSSFNPNPSGDGVGSTIGINTGQVYGSGNGVVINRPNGNTNYIGGITNNGNPIIPVDPNDLTTNPFAKLA